MSWPAPTRSYHEKFCQVEGWKAVRDARGRAIGHHVTYELHLLDGRILRTRISRPVNRDTYGPGMWSSILRDQLEVAAEEFWACVLEGTVPARSAPKPAADALPAQLVHLLIYQAKVPESEVAAMNKDEAIARLNQYWAESQDR
jgi:hypothetical protein